MKQYNKCRITTEEFNKLTAIIEKLANVVEEKTNYHTVVIDKFNPIDNTSEFENISLNEIKQFNLELSSRINEEVY